MEHINFLEKYAGREYRSEFEFKMKIARMQKNPSKESEIVNSTLKNIIKKAKINLIVHNLPKNGKRVIDNQEEFISARSISDTMKQFGKIDDVVIFRNTAYVWFSNLKDADRVHNLINHKCMGDKIIKTQLVF